MREQFSDECGGTPFMSPLETTPDRRPSSLSVPASLLQGPPSSDDSSNFIKAKKRDSVVGCMNKLWKIMTYSFAFRVWEHVRLGPSLSETLKGKLSLGARIIREGGREKIFIFKHIFSVKEGEKLLKASQCYLSTTAGPIAGLLFMSTERVAFWSERPISFTSASGDIARSPYKVLIPVRKIKIAYRSENVNNPKQKYIAIVTKDDFEFWFMGFLRYEKAFKNLEKAISMSN